MAAVAVDIWARAPHVLQLHDWERVIATDGWGRRGRRAASWRGADGAEQRGPYSGGEGGGAVEEGHLKSWVAAGLEIRGVQEDLDV